MSLAPHIVVIGGGIAGAFSAYFLARLGARATLVERDEIGAHASGSNPGGLNPLHGPGIPGPMQELALTALRLHRECWPEIAARAGSDVGPRRTPRLHVAVDERDLAELERAKALYDATPGFSARSLERDQLLRLEPRLDAAIRRGLLTDGNDRVDSGPYTRAVARAAAALGARAVGAEARGLVHRGDRVTGVRLDVDTLPCDGVVIASGPWCAEPARWLGISIAVEPVKGEMLLVAPAGGALQVDVAWRDTALYASADGAGVWVGGTEKRVGLDPAPSAEARASLLEALGRLLPGALPPRVLAQTAALRPVTPDGVPLVGMADGWRNVCLAVGGGRKGMLLGSAMGLAAAEIAVLGTTDVPIEACDPKRPGVAPGT